MKEYKKRFSDTIAKVLDERIKGEADSSQLYRAMGVWFDMYGFPNLANLYYKYSEEETDHSKLVYDYCLKRNYLPKTLALAQVGNEYSGIEEILQLTYEHEIQVTKWYEELAALCLKEGDSTTRVFAEEILAEQIEEEDKALLLCDAYRSLEDCPSRDFQFNALLDNLLK